MNSRQGTEHTEQNETRGAALQVTSQSSEGGARRQARRWKKNSGQRQAECCVLNKPYSEYKRAVSQAATVAAAGRPLQQPPVR